MAEVITKIQINDAITRGLTHVVLPEGAILTTLAREYAASKGITLITGAPGADEVRAAVIARLGEAPEGLDAAIAKVMG